MIPEEAKLLKVMTIDKDGWATSAAHAAFTAPLDRSPDALREYVNVANAPGSSVQHRVGSDIVFATAIIDGARCWVAGEWRPDPDNRPIGHALVESWKGEGVIGATDATEFMESGRWAEGDPFHEFKKLPNNGWVAMSTADADRHAMEAADLTDDQERPTCSELEQLLDSKDGELVDIHPDGTVGTKDALSDAGFVAATAAHDTPDLKMFTCQLQMRVAGETREDAFDLLLRLGNANGAVWRVIDGNDTMKQGYTQEVAVQMSKVGPMEKELTP
jgi:hypothetical protein